MNTPSAPPRVLHTTAGDVPFEEYRLRSGGREWTVLHSGALLTAADESRFLGENAGRLPYGAVLWPASIALAHDIASRAGAFAGRKVLELGAGIGLPGIIAASAGAHVVQTDQHEVVLALCRLNAERNGVTDIRYRLEDWTDWGDDARYDWILGSDILYREAMHPHLRRILESGLIPGGRALIADPFRSASVRLLDGLESAGWRISVSKWSVIVDSAPRPIGIFELEPPLEG